MFRTNFLPFLFMTLTISACGEPLKSSFHGDLTGFGSGLQRSFWTHDPSIDGEMDADKKILHDYRMELEGRENRTTLLSRRIKAFDLNLSKASDNEFNLTARITFGCDNFLDYKKRVSGSDLNSMKVVNLETKENYNLLVECTNTNCSQMVAAIRNTNPGDSATVLVGLRADKKVEGQLIYTTRSVAYTPYFQTFYGYGHYSRKNRCSTGGNNSMTHQLIDLFNKTVIDKLRDKANDKMKDILEDVEELFS